MGILSTMLYYCQECMFHLFCFRYALKKLLHFPPPKNGKKRVQKCDTSKLWKKKYFITFIGETIHEEVLRLSLKLERYRKYGIAKFYGHNRFFSV